jgi:phosphoribosylformylglycinamidine (FGAM) synthase-like enzyme
MLEKQTMNRIDNMARAGSDRKTVSFTVGAILLATTWMAISLFGTGLSAAQVSTSANPYVGIWKMTVLDKRVGTLELMNYNGRLTGTLTNAHATMDSNGKLVEFDAIPGAAPIVQASISQGMLVN